MEPRETDSFGVQHPTVVPENFDPTEAGDGSTADERAGDQSR